MSPLLDKEDLATARRRSEEAGQNPTFFFQRIVRLFERMSPLLDKDPATTPDPQMVSGCAGQRDQPRAGLIPEKVCVLSFGCF